jgi:sugar-specific transcriptional regulator TrmB
LTQEWMLKTLMDLGFKRDEAKVYVLLALNGSYEAKKIMDNLKIYKRKVYRILKKLESKKIVYATSEIPAQFSAIPFNRVLDLLIRDTREEANRIEEKKEEILALWRFNTKEDTAN